MWGQRDRKWKSISPLSCRRFMDWGRSSRLSREKRPSWWGDTNATGKPSSTTCRQEFICLFIYFGVLVVFMPVIYTGGRGWVVAWRQGWGTCYHRFRCCSIRGDHMSLSISFPPVTHSTTTWIQHRCPEFHHEHTLWIVFWPCSTSPFSWGHCVKLPCTAALRHKWRSYQVWNSKSPQGQTPPCLFSAFVRLGNCLFSFIHRFFPGSL